MATNYKKESDIHFNARVKLHLENERLRARIADAELSLNVYDPGHDSEYWLRYEQNGCHAK